MNMSQVQWHTHKKLSFIMKYTILCTNSKLILTILGGRKNRTLVVSNLFSIFFSEIFFQLSLWSSGRYSKSMWGPLLWLSGSQLDSHRAETDALLWFRSLYLVHDFSWRDINKHGFTSTERALSHQLQVWAFESAVSTYGRDRGLVKSCTTVESQPCVGDHCQGTSHFLC